jgi:hypothetical protein
VFLSGIDPNQRTQLVDDFNNPQAQLRVFVYNFSYSPLRAIFNKACADLGVRCPKTEMTLQADWLRGAFGAIQV